MTTAEARDKIQKLLRLGRSANQHEAELAMQRAMEIALRHGLSVEEIDPDSEHKEFTERYVRVGARVSYEGKLAGWIVTTYFGCKCILGNPNIAFVGAPFAVEIAEYVWTFLVRTARQHKRRFKKANRRARHGAVANYLDGFFVAISHKLDDTVKLMIKATPGFELAQTQLNERLKRYCSQEFRLVKADLPSYRRNRTAQGLGYAHGSTVEIRKPLAGVTAPAALEVAS